MKILSIGNSYSQDSTRYLHQLAQSCGVELDTANLFIGGCPLSLHHRNMLSEEKAYRYELNGKYTYLNASIKEALLAADWDVVTLQQQSFRSTDYSTFQPYLNNLAEYVRKHVPQAKIAMHQTWGYRDGEACLQHYQDGSAMFADVEKSYDKAMQDINADIILKSGKAFEMLKENGISDFYRDSIHASLGLGRYTLGLVWLKTLTGTDPHSVGEIKLDEAISEKDMEIAKKVAAEI
ncbi:MAG: DUF4886 domain-containing protein [Clostridia bacterium]|nr:DUF4886 domain-containing protein [Clostridia bacterium]